MRRHSRRCCCTPRGLSCWWCRPRALCHLNGGLCALLAEAPLVAQASLHQARRRHLQPAGPTSLTGSWMWATWAVGGRWRPARVATTLTNDEFLHPPARLRKVRPHRLRPEANDGSSTRSTSTWCSPHRPSGGPDTVGGTDFAGQGLRERRASPTRWCSPVGVQSEGPRSPVRPGSRPGSEP